MIQVRKMVAATAMALTVGLMTTGAAPAAQQDFGYYYDYTYFSDATHTIVVGATSEYCHNSTTIRTTVIYGHASPYYERWIVGRCPGPGDW